MKNQVNFKMKYRLVSLDARLLLPCPGQSIIFSTLVVSHSHLYTAATNPPGLTLEAPDRFRSAHDF